MDNDLARKLATIAFDTINETVINPVAESWEREKRERYIDRVTEQLQRTLTEHAK